MLNCLQGHASFGPGIAAHLYIFLATVLQALLLSAAAAVRLSGIRRERDTARAESERLRSLAETDPLTGLLNRRGLVHRARAILSKEMGSALVLIDFDHFKEVDRKSVVKGKSLSVRVDMGGPRILQKKKKI